MCISKHERDGDHREEQGEQHGRPRSAVFQGDVDDQVGNGGADVQRVLDAPVDGAQLQYAQRLDVAGKKLLHARLEHLVARAFDVLQLLPYMSKIWC